MKSKKLDLAVVHLTIEGIAARGGGVCTVTRGHLATLPRVRKTLASHGIRLTPYFVETDFNEDYPSFDPSFFKKAKKYPLTLHRRSNLADTPLLILTPRFKHIVFSSRFLS